MELKNGYNNYIDELTINSKKIINVMSKIKENVELQKDKKTVAYMSFKKINENRDETFYITKMAEKA